MKKRNHTDSLTKYIKWATKTIFIISLLFSLPSGIFAGFACLSNPCINGICIDDINSTYSCYCIDGFTGIQCQTNWDECWSSPCKNGGSCIDGIAEYNCTCPDGYIGSDCEIDFNECDSNPCQNNGTCIDATNEFSCLCLPGYSGPFCEIDMSVCNTTEDTRCHNGGHCIEGLGISFTCSCAKGWEGKLCELETNECKSSPCQNGGICIDEHADYYCACPFGYTGKSCESVIELCSNNTCTNNALCIMEDSIKICYCVPDYHGEKCQYQYDECLLGPRCMNGGTCIDGVDNFTCSCPPLLTGMLCECLILDDNEMDCTYVSPPTSSTESTTSFSSTSHTEIQTHSTESEGTSALSITSTDVEVDFSTATSYITKDTTPSTLSWDQSTNVALNNYSTEATTYTFFKTDMTGSLYTEMASTPLSMSTESSLATSKFSTEDIYTKTSSSYTTKDDSVFSTTPTFITSTDFTSDQTTSQTMISISTSKTIYPTVYETTASNIDDTTLMYSTTDQDTTTDRYHMTTISREENRSTTEESEVTTATETEDFQTTKSYYTTISTIDNTTVIKPTTFYTTTFEGTSTEEISSTEIWTTTFVSSITNVTDDISVSTESFHCSEIVCFNGGTCVESADGPKCMCKFDYGGAFCETMLGIASAAFSGDSYLTHKLQNASGIIVQLKARTFSSEGLILYAHIGQNIYMCLYIHKGLLRFQFSCGYQTMLLSELENPINNGYELDIKAILELTDGRRHCNASLHMNETLAMSGGQMVSAFYPSSNDSWLHLGAISDTFKSSHHVPSDVDSFTGCMLALRIDGKLRHIFNDASDGYEIKECSSLVCLSNPCSNGGTCNDHQGNWFCSCSNGYLGTNCEKSVCATNPCYFGGTCVQHPGSGFLCLCPLGKHGLYCEHNLEIAQPSFSSMVSGLSSFAVYQLPTNLVSRGMEIRFRIQPNNMDQISLLAFMGQSGLHDPKSDHMAVTFVKGYIMLTWNLGNGPRRIFTSRPITIKDGKSHLVKIGRLGRSAWLTVDNMQNITGNAPGNLIHLDVVPLLFIGGHESVNFTHLPHDLPLHGGFSGCIWDLWIGSVGSKSNGVMWNPIRGRAVGQCSVTQCHSMACHNNGACLHHSATFSCFCTEGWFGPLCTNHQNPCDTGNNKCSQGSTCIPTTVGYQCDCALGTSGVYCENEMDFSDVSFSGVRSYLQLNVPLTGDVHFSVDFELRPLHPKGILFYTESVDECFISLSLQGGLLEYRWAGHEWGGKQIGNKIVIIVRSGVVLSLGSWHTIRAGRYGRKLFLWVDGTMTTETLTSHHFFTAFNTSVFIGGVHDLSTLPPDATSGHPMPFTGCMRKLSINSKHFPLNKANIIESRNINDCDGDICGGDICWNGGTCVIVQKNDKHEAKCICQLPYTGPQCLHTVPCKPNECNKGRCIQGTCICPNGWTGYSCQNQIKVTTPQFKGNSYIAINKNKMQESHKQLTHNKIRYKRSGNHVYMNFTTAKHDGLLLWSELNEKKFISIGLESGYLKISWTIPNRMKSDKNKHINRLHSYTEPPYETNIIKILQAGRLSNGDWHSLDLKFHITNITVMADGKIVYEENGVSYEENDSYPILYIGGFPHNTSTRRRTHGLYSSNFIGCISEISVGSEERHIQDFSHFESENIDVCQLF